MTLSPVVTTTLNEPQVIRAIGSPAARALDSGNTSSSGTPRPAPTSIPPSAPPTLDLAEQMNLEEKRKYVKGSRARLP